LHSLTDCIPEADLTIPVALYAANVVSLQLSLIIERSGASSLSVSLESTNLLQF